MIQPTYITCMSSVFSTCSYRCGYCTIAETGAVKDKSQLEFYRDIKFVNRITNFFNSRTSEDQKWHLQLTGGEPLLMPNFELFCDNLASKGNKISIYTNLSLPKSHKHFKYLLEDGGKAIEFLMVTLHPEAYEKRDLFFEKIKILKAAGLKVLVRFISHPKSMNLLEDVNDRCKEIDVCFYVNNLISSKYPQAYTAEEKEKVASYSSSSTQLYMLEGGIDTSGVLCNAGHRNISADFISGIVTPCVYFDKAPELGNIHQDTLKLNDGPQVCPKAGMNCSCDMHYHEELPVGLEGREVFERQKLGYVEPLTKEQAKVEMDKFRKTGMSFSKQAIHTGQVKDDSLLVFSQKFVEEQHKVWRSQHEDNYEKICNDRLVEIENLKKICDEREEACIKSNAEAEMLREDSRLQREEAEKRLNIINELKAENDRRQVIIDHQAAELERLRKGRIIKRFLAKFSSKDKKSGDDIYPLW